MKKIKNCKHCFEQFESRRSNHVYCSLSCKTKASYKRNDYKYIPGHYKKQKEDALAIPENELPVSNELIDAVKALETKIENINGKPEISSGSISNAAIGSAAADGAIYATKAIFATKTLPATKGDVEELKKEIQNLKLMFRLK